ncbi:MAG TPA: alpha/beta hydrolase [Chitinophagaceae bacterium]|jgi:pimeloyl-ACP methyl ester carboxylesterase|nr:alpha/beta hydrolase [Chitinophagaceae bacterium]
MKTALFLGFLLPLLVGAQSVTYPFPVQYLHLQPEGVKARMAYMDVQPEKGNGRTVLLLHGKNFNGFYWRTVIPFLQESGFRVVVPDQLGWGRSDKPDIHYSFHSLAQHTRALLDTLQVDKVTVIGHSMGGMLATRFALLFPGRVEKLVLENPIGLEDYRTFVPYQTLEQLVAKEERATYESYKKYQQSYYPQWKPEYEPYVAAQAEALNSPGFKQTARINARTYQMIYEQPVVYEFRHLKVPTLLIIGREDRTVVGKDQLSAEEAEKRGRYMELGRWLLKEIPGARLAELPGVGHIPHIQDPGHFREELFTFLR